MKKNKELNNFHNDLLSNFENIDVLILNYKKKIKKEYQNILIEEKNKLLLKISEGENINLNDLKNKYLKPKEIILLDEKDILLIENNEELLDKILLNNEIYYYENKEKGKVYDIYNNEVGVYKNGSIVLNKL